MKTLLRYLLLVLTFGTSLAFAQNEIEMINDVIRLNQSLAHKKFDGEISLTILDSSYINASATYASLSVTIHSEIIKLMADYEILWVVCHEVGHLLGENSVYKKPSGGAAEAEADYFAGSCMVNYLEKIQGFTNAEAQDESYKLATNAIRKLSRTRNIISARAYHNSYSEGQVNVMYPDNDCRLLSIENGIAGLARPECWYNP